MQKWLQYVLIFILGIVAAVILGYLLAQESRWVQEWAVKQLVKQLPEDHIITDNEYVITLNREKRPGIELSIRDVSLINSSGDTIKDLRPGMEAVIKVNYTHAGRSPRNLKLTCQTSEPTDCDLKPGAGFSKTEIDEWFTFRKEKPIHETDGTVELKITVSRAALTGDLCLKIQFVEGTAGKILATKTQDFHVHKP